MDQVSTRARSEDVESRSALVLLRITKVEVQCEGVGNGSSRAMVLVQVRKYPRESHALPCLRGKSKSILCSYC